MSTDLFERETENYLSTMETTPDVDARVFDGFVKGSARYAMRAFAKAGSAIDILGAVGPIAKDLGTGGTEQQDRYFREHKVWEDAVDYWTPQPHEVGVAAEIVGDLFGTLTQIFASPALAIGSLQVGEAEQLIRRGVPATPAMATGAIQAAGLGVGIYVPILGRTFLERAIAGGIGFNLLQGTVTRGLSGKVLEGTIAEQDYQAFGLKELTLDALLGLAFGSAVHLSPKARAQGKVASERLIEWAKSFTPSQRDAIATLRIAQHLNKDSLPGTPKSPADVEAHVRQLRTAINQMLRDEPINVGSLDDELRWEGEGGAIREAFTHDPVREAERAETQQLLNDEIRMARRRDQEEALGARLSEMDGEQIEAEIARIKAHNDAIERDAIAKYHPDKLSEYDSITSQRKKDKWVNDNISDQAQQYMNDLMEPEDFAKGFRGAAGAFDETSARALGKSIAIIAKDIDNPRFWATPEGTTVKHALRYAEAQGWDMNEVLAGMRSRAAQWAGSDAPELFSRLFKKTKEITKAIEDFRVTQDIRPERPASEVPVAKPSETVPPPRGERVAEAAGTEGKTGEKANVLDDAVTRWLSENPDMVLTIGKDADGKSITITAKEYMETINEQVEQAREDAGLFKIAAECLLKGGD